MSSATPDGVYLLDTSIIILSLRGNDTMRMRIAATVRQMYIPSIALGELYFGAYSSPTRPQEAVADVAALAASNVILGTDAATGDVYAQIKHDLKQRGFTMPDNDLWIAATAMQYDVTLVARDAHFNWISGLRIEQW